MLFCFSLLLLKKSITSTFTSISRYIIFYRKKYLHNYFIVTYKNKINTFFEFIYLYHENCAHYHTYCALYGSGDLFDEVMLAAAAGGAARAAT